MTYDMEVAKTIYRVGRELQVTDKVMLAAFETGIVESGMRNLDHGDKDSLGVFQQRPSQGWGTAEQIMNPDHAARKFFEKAIPDDRENPHQTPGQLAQGVQRSAYPARYDQQEGEARKLLGDAAAQSGAPAPGPTPPTPPGGPAPNFGTWGNQVNVRKDAALDAPVVTTLTGPTSVFVEYQRRGDIVNAEGLSNPFWSYVPALGGFLSNIFIDHPDAHLPGVPDK